MSDARLREIERRVAAGDPQARAAWLLERLRAGLLGPEALELAAFAGDAAARAALGQAAPSRAPDAPEALARSLSRFGPRACVLAGVLAGEAALAAPETDPVDPASVPAEGPELGRVALAAARAWIACPCPRHAGAASSAAALASQAASGSGQSWTILEPEEAAAAREELRREVAPPNQAPLRDMLPFARGGNGDDVAGVVLQDGTPLSTVCTVHLTWAMGPEQPGWPSLRLIPGAAAFVEEALLGPDYLDDPGEPARVRAAAIYAASFPAAPSTLGLCPEVGAAIALCCAAQVLGPVETRAAVLAGLAAWALG